MRQKAHRLSTADRQARRIVLIGALSYTLHSKVRVGLGAVRLAVCAASSIPLMRVRLPPRLFSLAAVPLFPNTPAPRYQPDTRIFKFQQLCGFPSDIEC